MLIRVNTSNGLENKDALERWADGEIRQCLSHFADDVTRVEVHLSDDKHTPSGRGDMRCVLEARLARHQPLAVTHHAPNMDEAFRGACEKLKHALDRTLGRLHDHHRDRTSIRTIAANTPSSRPVFQPRPGPRTIKHSSSSLMDLEIEAVEYDDDARVVTLKSDAFDSSLVASFVLQDLRDAGIIAYYDETGGAPAPGARWQLMFSLAGVPYECEVALQSDIAGVQRPAARLTHRG